ncbi:uncharacterized protein DUF2147 [Marinoscillum furvescens DSM 4134]|uniref:Uncharacterized protein DUF2147 n=2 Tax=Marinoscillum furvescens TaxID=1026 RepID=A0A3D9L825_MARFU|nr:uncharacterized protein DUF2147 [Marinoscillum furvescens DSM 4134]
MKTHLTLILLLLGSALSAQTITGKWKTIDDETGKPRSVVKIEKRGDKYFGTIERLFREPGEEQDPVCEVCPGSRKNQKVIGMEIITDMEYDADDEEYTGGEILDPESGNLYDCKLWVEDGNLKVRGYVMFLYRTQTWLPYE